MEYTVEQINDIVLATIVKTIGSFKRIRVDGGDLNEINFDYIIDCRLRDMSDTSILDNLILPNDNKHQV